MKDRRENLLFLAWATSLVAMMGSLYFSQIKQFEPCELCWFQRILMYPQVILLGIASVKKDYKISLYTTVLSAMGGCLSIYHYSLQKISFVSNSAPSCGRVPCSGEYINLLGFITIPLLALIAFIIIFTVSMFILKASKGSANE